MARSRDFFRGALGLHVVAGGQGDAGDAAAACWNPRAAASCWRNCRVPGRTDGSTTTCSSACATSASRSTTPIAGRSASPPEACSRGNPSTPSAVCASPSSGTPMAPTSSWCRTSCTIRRWSPPLAAAEAAVPAPRRPRFDHVALSVTDVGRTLTLTGGPRLRGHRPPRHTTHQEVSASPTSWRARPSSSCSVTPRPCGRTWWVAGAEAPGLLRVGVASTHPRRTLRDGGGRRHRVGAGYLDRAGTHEVAVDGDGTPYEIGRTRAGGTP